jgi:hypothetical protein
MVTVPEKVREIILQSPFLEEGLASGIINLSALARQLLPQIEKELIKNVEEMTVVMALKRLSAQLKKKSYQMDDLLKNMKDLTVRLNLVEFTFRNSDFLLEKQKLLLQELSGFTDEFVTITRGVFEIAIIISADAEKLVEEIFEEEEKISKISNLAAIIIKLPPKAISVPGVHYSILKHLAWGNINVVEVVSTFTEFTIIIGKDQIDNAFSILKRFLWI